MECEILSLNCKSQKKVRRSTWKDIGRKKINKFKSDYWSLMTKWFHKHTQINVLQQIIPIEIMLGFSFSILANYYYCDCDNRQCEDMQFPLHFEECIVIFTWKMGMNGMWQYTMWICAISTSISRFIRLCTL